MSTVKTDKIGFVKQEDGLVLNNNLHELEYYKTKVKEVREGKKDAKKIQKLENKINSLESKIDLILEKLLRDS